MIHHSKKIRQLLEIEHFLVSSWRILSLSLLMIMEVWTTMQKIKMIFNGLPRLEVMVENGCSCTLLTVLRLRRLMPMLFMWTEKKVTSTMISNIMFLISSGSIWVETVSINNLKEQCSIGTLALEMAHSLTSQRLPFLHGHMSQLNRCHLIDHFQSCLAIRD